MYSFELNCHLANKLDGVQWTELMVGVPFEDHRLWNQSLEYSEYTDPDSSILRLSSQKEDGCENADFPNLYLIL